MMQLMVEPPSQIVLLSEKAISCVVERKRLVVGAPGWRPPPMSPSEMDPADMLDLNVSEGFVCW